MSVESLTDIVEDFDDDDSQEVLEGTYASGYTGGRYLAGPIPTCSVDSQAHHEGKSKGTGHSTNGRQSEEGGQPVPSSPFFLLPPLSPATIKAQPGSQVQRASNFFLNTSPHHTSGTQELQSACTSAPPETPRGLSSSFPIRGKFYRYNFLSSFLRLITVTNSTRYASYITTTNFFSFHDLADPTTG